ncbi:hypothetical protein ACJ73_05894, partial [Blastomyces percursus]
MSTKTDLVALLQSPADFESWDRAFRTQVQNVDLKKEIFGEKPLLQKPTTLRRPEPPRAPNIVIK